MVAQSTKGASVGSITTVVTAFNLICTGTATTGKVQGVQLLDQQAGPFSSIYRVDLSEKKWCVGACVANSPIKLATDQKLVLEQVTDGDALITAIDLASGMIIHKETKGISVRIEIGSCKRAEFTGLVPSNP
jgi:hypothetical protein